MSIKLRGPEEGLTIQLTNLANQQEEPVTPQRVGRTEGMANLPEALRPPLARLSRLCGLVPAGAPGCRIRQRRLRRDHLLATLPQKGSTLSGATAFTSLHLGRVCGVRSKNTVFLHGSRDQLQRQHAARNLKILCKTWPEAARPSLDDGWPLLEQHWACWRISSSILVSGLASQANTDPTLHTINVVFHYRQHNTIILN